MSVTAAEAEDALWTVKRGDDWRFGGANGWSSDDDLSTWDDETVLVQIRRGDSADSTLVASSDVDDVGDGVVAIDLTGTTFTASDSVLMVHIEDADTAELPVGDLFIEAECEIDGDVVTFLPARVLSVVDQVAVS